jgi:acetylornithine deacetylase/succinyl-diaminopimelate desuccinylase-like protein
MFDRGVPSICYSLRGLAYFQIDFRGSAGDLHSGQFGGALVNPAMALAQVLAQMKDRSGRIKIPGFYDDVRELSTEERDAWKALPFNEKKFRKEVGAPKLFGEKGYTTLERLWARPTFEVNGLLSGFTGDGAKTVLPAVVTAPSIVGFKSGSAASFSRVVVRRGCSSTAKVIGLPSRPGTSIGKISSAKRPSSMAASARWCER